MKRLAESEQRRQRVLEAARACFGAHGFSGATVGAIAQRAGVSNGLLYQFFRNKEHLFEVVVEALIRDWVRAMVRTKGERDGLEAGDKLEQMFRRSVAFCRTNPLMPRLLTRDQMLQLSRFSDVGSNRVAPHRELVAGILREGIEAREFRADLDVESVADVICQLQADYSTRAYRRDPQFPAHPALIDAAVRFVRDAVSNGS